MAPRAGRTGLAAAFWASRAAELRARDTKASQFFASLLVAATIYNVRAARGAADARTAAAALAWMVGHLAFDLAILAVIAHDAPLHRRHRAASLAALRGASLALMVIYVPLTWSFTVPRELAAGKHAALAYRLVFGGCLSAVGLMEPLAYLLPLRIATPYFVARAAGSAALLPRLLRVFVAHPRLQVVARAMYRDACWLFGGAAGSVLATVAPLTESAAPCPVAALMLLVHAALAAVIPLYILGVQEARGVRAFAAARAAARRGPAPAPGDPAPAALARAAAASGAAGSSGAAAAAVPAPELPAGPTRPELGLVGHGVVLSCLVVLLWAIIDTGVTLWGRRLLEPHGLCV
ncbi:hypothetical protein HT031_004703 [Scenedesmus sp. PABB004]|nr:hypothetical protein HT031_004703 [Scenedesmus sp. PABB004]